MQTRRDSSPYAQPGQLQSDANRFPDLEPESSRTPVISIGAVISCGTQLLKVYKQRFKSSFIFGFVRNSCARCPPNLYTIASFLPKDARLPPSLPPSPLDDQDVETVDPVLNPLLNRELQRTGGRTLIRLGSEDIDFSPDFLLLLVTRNPGARFAPDLCSRVTIVNFTVTPASLQSQVCLCVVNQRCC